MAFSITRLRALHLKRSPEGDFNLLCQGKTIRAHSFVLATSYVLLFHRFCLIVLFRSAFFEAALFKDWRETNSRRMELKSCSFGALEVAVNFMYHCPIPHGFSEYIELLHLTDMFMMDDLKEETAAQLARNLSEENYLETSQAAELYHAESLILECADFVLENVVNVNWEEMGKLPKVVSAMVSSQSPIPKVMAAAEKREKDYFQAAAKIKRAAAKKAAERLAMLKAAKRRNKLELLILELEIQIEEIEGNSCNADQQKSR